MEVEAAEAAVSSVAASFGYILKDKQLEAITQFISGNDTFVALPTGYGKSIIYGLLPRVFDSLRPGMHDAGDSIAIIVCPLKALMKDQTSHFRNIGISAAFGGEPNISMDRFIRGEFQLIFLSPECLNGRAWREILKSNVYQKKVIAFVVDEAHLIKNW